MSYNGEIRRLRRKTGLVRGPKPDNEPAADGIEIITITENEDSGYGYGGKKMKDDSGLGEEESRTNVRLARKRRSNANYNRWTEHSLSLITREDEKCKRGEKRSNNVGLSGLKFKRTPCPNVVAGKDGIIRSLDASSGLSKKGGDGGRKESGKEETRRRKESNRGELRDNPRAVAEERKRDSPPEETSIRIARPVLPAPDERQLLGNSQPTPDDEFSLSPRLNNVPVVIDIDEERETFQSIANDQTDHLFDFEIIDVTDVVAMTRVLTTDSDSGVCLATLRDHNSGSGGQRGSIFDSDPVKKNYVNLNDVKNSQQHGQRDVDNLNKRNVNNNNFDGLRDERAMDVQHALIADQDGDRPLHIAVVHQDVVLVRQLCALVKSVGASLDMYNCLHQTPLHLSVILGDQHMCEALLEEGAKPYLRDRNGDSALHLAVKFKSVDCLNVILRSKLSKNILNERNYEGLSCLHISVAQEEMVSAFYLVKAGCDINIQEGKSGRTPLINAVLSAKFDVVRILMKLGASLLSTDYAGSNALLIANELENRDISLYLEAKMASLKA